MPEEGKPPRITAAHSFASQTLALDVEISTRQPRKAEEEKRLPTSNPDEESKETPAQLTSSPQTPSNRPFFRLPVTKRGPSLSFCFATRAPKNTPAICVRVRVFVYVCVYVCAHVSLCVSLSLLCACACVCVCVCVRPCAWWPALKRTNDQACGSRIQPSRIKPRMQR